MAYKVTYGTNNYRIADDEDLTIFLEAVEEAIKGHASRWVIIPSKEPTRILITDGVEITVTGVPVSKPRVAFSM